MKALAIVCRKSDDLLEHRTSRKSRASVGRSRSVSHLTAGGTWLVCLLVPLALLLAVTVTEAAEEPFEIVPAIKALLRESQSERIEPLPKRTSLVETLSGETLLESIENLPNFDDTVWVMGTVMSSGTIAGPTFYEYQRQLIPRLNRVRKILGKVDADRDTVVVVLMTKLAESAEGFDQIDRAVNRAIAFSDGGLTLTEPDEWGRRITIAPAATYILGELGVHEALPVMAEICAAEGAVPVNRLFLFYTMHCLAMSHPRNGLSPEAIESLVSYLASTRDLPSPETKSVPSWQASHEETDFRHMIVGQDIGLDRMPQIQMRIYPKSLAELEVFGGKPTPELEILIEKLVSFIELAYSKG